jgi:uncharacterized protein (DUF1697 family)
MMTCIAMLRGINVGGSKPVKMQRLRASFQELGFKNVSTYLQSGNVVFQAPSSSPTSLASRIEQQIQKDFGFDVSVLVRTAGELSQVVTGNPFLKDKGMDTCWLHITFLSQAAPGTAAKSLEPLAATAERFKVSGREIFLFCPNGYGRTKLSNNAIEKKLSVGATTRNWNTVNALLQMAEAIGRNAGRDSAQGTTRTR